jgi:DNA-binding NarL/FixJ family response regulator
VTRADMVRVLVVDDQQIVRRGIAALLQLEPDLDVIGEAADGEEAITKAQDLRPDVVIMDVRMPGVSGTEATRDLVGEVPSQPDLLTKVLILSTFKDEDIVYDCLRAGASGFVLKDAAPEDLADAIRAVARGDSWLDPSVAGQVIAALRSASPPEMSPTALVDLLTPRERETLALVARGYSNSEISEAWVVSEATVKTHISRILMKTGARDRASAVVLAYESHLVSPRKAQS